VVQARLVVLGIVNVTLQFLVATFAPGKNLVSADPARCRSPPAPRRRRPRQGTGWRGLRAANIGILGAALIGIFMPT
jgi:hypothetical protein